MNRSNMLSEAFAKFTLYTRAVAATGSPNWTGFPLLPKTSYSPASRANYNTFLLWLKKLSIDKADVIFDVGANHGDFSSAASAVYPQACVWLFEPQPSLVPTLRKIAEKHHGLWQIEPIGIGREDTILELQIAADDAIASFLGFSNSYREANPGGASIQSIRTEVRRLDTIWRRLGSTPIDVLKIDVEGLEFDVLEGGHDALQATSAVIIEVSLIREKDDETSSLAQMLTTLTGMGFHIIDVMPSFFSRKRTWQPLEYNILARRAG